MHYAGLSRFFAKKVDYVSGHSSAIYYRIELICGPLEPTQWALQEMYQGSKAIGGHLRELGSKNPIFWRFLTVFVENLNFFDANIFLEFFWRRNLIEELSLRDPTKNGRDLTVNKRENGRRLWSAITTSGLNRNRKYIFFSGPGRYSTSHVRILFEFLRNWRRYEFFKQFMKF